MRLIATSGPDGRRRSQTVNFAQNFTLAVVVVDVPPLRERRQDVPLLDQAIQHFSNEFGRVIPSIHPHQRENLINHAWPGNVRELLNLGERAVVMGNNAFNFEMVAKQKQESGLPSSKLASVFRLS